MADRDDEADGRPSLRPYDEPWYRRLPNDAASFLYGDNATMRQAEGMRTLMGPHSLFNLPGLAHEGVDISREGLARGDYPSAAFGALQTGLAVTPFGSFAKQAATAPFRAYLESQAAKHAAEAMKGPWGNPGMLEKQLDQPQMPRNEISLPFHRDQIEAYQKQGIPHSPFSSGPLTDEQKAENFAYTQKLDQLRNGYADVSPDSTYGMDLAARDAKAQRMVPMSPDLLRKEYDDLIDRSKTLMQREKQTDLQYDPIEGTWVGVEGNTKPDYNRPWYRGENEELAPNYMKYRRRRNAHIDWGPTPEEGMAEDLRTFAGNNEHNPKLMQQADALADQVSGINARQAPHWDRLQRERDAWNKVIFGPDSLTSERRRIGYYHDVDRFQKEGEAMGRPYVVPRGHDPAMEIDELNKLLKMDPRARGVADNPELAQQIYDDFWRHERELRNKGLPTNHDLYLEHMKQQERQALREMGLDPDRSTPEEQEAAWHKEFDSKRKEIDDIKKQLGLLPEDKFLDAVFPEQADRMRAVGNNVARYLPPTAVGAYAANRVLNWPEAKRLNPTPDGKPVQQPEPTPFKYEAPPQLADPDEHAYLKHAVNKNLEDADRDATWSGARELLHGIGGPMGMIGMPKWWGKAGWGALQAKWFTDAMKDRQAADDRMQTWKAQKEGYVDRLPELNPDDYQD